MEHIEEIEDLHVLIVDQMQVGAEIVVPDKYGYYEIQ